ncbi:SDR family oxidoreductase [Clostridium formicaceticum]|uniref:Oxidoreductase n=1 Tax=Clostridium formicaceticum TaxID=1497 RepID=A0AAC9WGT9_9CLOT|nr:D-mannonate oxidoreductase [Clostridium formicaceticum]ARE88216.1 putative oxidoreductase [Clostridium formicaceticum]
MEISLEADMTDKVIVITGGTGVLCAAIVEMLAVKGAKIGVIDINEEALNKMQEAYKNRGLKVLSVHASVLDKNSLEKAKDIIHEKLGKVDILINGAGGNHPKGTTSSEYLYIKDIDTEDIVTFYDLDKEGIEFVFNLNFLGTLLPSQVFTKDMLGKEGCCVINVSSMNAFTPLTKIPAYSAAKSAVSNLTQWMAVHFSKVGIRVNAIAPGFFLTAQNHKLLINEDGSFTERAEKIISNTPMERFGKKEELLGSIQFLINEKASGFINGVVLPIDGGFSAYSGV